VTPGTNTLVIRTPEGIEFGLRLAGPFSRMLAYSIDLAVIGAFGFVLQRLLAPLRFFGEDASGALITAFYFTISLIYMSLAEWTWRGQSVGKRLLGLRVVEANGLRLELPQVIVRNLMRFIDALPVLYLVGAVSCVLNRRRQRLGDVVAGTVVVRTPKLAEPNLDQLRGNKYNSLAEHRHLAARLRQKATPEIARLAFEAVLRRDEFEPASRLVLFNELADHFRALVAYPAEAVEQLSDEQYVRGVVEVLFTGSLPHGQ
jgi:uncharacterized RDD family membrane protein YckC